MIYKVDYAGHTVRYRLRSMAVRYEFGRHMSPAEGEEYDVYADDARMERMRSLLPERASEPYVEYRCLMEPTSLKLLEFGCCIFHAAAFAYKDRAWLLAGRSGVGKTTQIRNWRRLFPGEIELISGDMPIIEAMDDGRVWVHTSPWNGKERWAGRGNGAELGGIVLLQQAKVNEFTPLSPSDAVLPLFRQFVVRPETREQVHALARLADRAFSSAPAVLYRDLGDDDSTVKLRGLIDGLAERK